MRELLTNVGLVLVFVIVGGVFAASEIALISLRDSQVRRMAERGGAGATVARLTADSNRFLSAVQVGVTLAGFFSASYGAATIAPLLSPWIVRWGVPAGLAGTIAFVGTTIVISYLSLVLGELVPKRLAMQAAEPFSLLVARPLDTIASILRPVIWLLGASTDLVMRLLGRDPDAQKEEMNTEELRSLVAAHGSLLGEERDMVVDLLASGERTVEEIMTPRTEVSFLDADMPVGEVRPSLQVMGHSRYPVRGRDNDDLLGFVHVRDLFAPGVEDTLVGDLAREVTHLPGSKPILSALTEMRALRAHLAVVVDEYGGTDGIVTIEDVVEEFVGDIEDEYDRSDGSQRPAPGRVDGLLGRAEVSKQLHRDLPEGHFDTLGGFLMSELGRVPRRGDSVAWEGLLLTVDGLDGRRVDTVRVRPLASSLPVSSGSRAAAEPVSRSGAHRSSAHPEG